MLCGIAVAILALPSNAAACRVAGLTLQRTVGERTGTLGATAGSSFAVPVRPGHRHVFAVQGIDAKGQAEPCVARLGTGFWRLGREDPEVWTDPLIAAGTSWP